MPIPQFVEVVEVGMRDGLQIEPAFVPTSTKIDLINQLLRAGIRHMEATSFVSPRAVPQLADAAEVLAGVQKPDKAKLSALSPNHRGTERAIQAGADEIVLFLSASESHNQKNLNRPIERSLQDITDNVQLARSAGIPCKGAIAVAFGCPFEGDVPVSAVQAIAGHLVARGIDSITLGDTTGMATPKLVYRTVEAMRTAFPEVKLSLHFHNTRGIGLVNVVAGLEAGITSFESSIGGLGGCPFAPGATGNICTEDLVNLLHEMDIRTGINLDLLIETAHAMRAAVGHSLPGQVMKAGPRSRLHSLESTACAIG